MTEYQPYGVRHFLRRLDAEGASELGAARSGCATGRRCEGGYANVDEFALADLLVYRTLVLRALAGREPAAVRVRLPWRGRWYEVWQRPG